MEDIDAIRRRIDELEAFHKSSSDFSGGTSTLIENFYLDFEKRLKQMETDSLDIESLGFHDLDAYVESAKEKLDLVESENVSMLDEITHLENTVMEDTIKFEHELEQLKQSLSFFDSRGSQEEDDIHSISADRDHNFEILDLNHQIDKGRATLNKLEDLAGVFKWVEAHGELMNVLSDVEVIEFQGNCIRLSLRTFIPIFGGSLCEQKIECITEPTVLKHELLIEVIDGTLKLKNVEIFPNDVSITQVVDAARSFSYSSSLSVSEIRSPLEWLVRKIQFRIFCCSLRLSIVKSANTLSRHFDYSDKEEVITAHLVGGINALLKVPSDWPASHNELKLISLKNSGFDSREISLNFLCKVEELANSLDTQTRCHLSRFADAIEGILIQQMRTELH